MEIYIEILKYCPEKSTHTKIFCLPGMLMNLTAEFVKTVNMIIQKMDTRNKDHMKIIDELRSKIKKVMMKCENSEFLVNSILSKIEENKKTCNDVVYVRKEGNIKAIISRDVLKPTIYDVKKLEIHCECLMSPFGVFNTFNGYFIVEKEEDLRVLDSHLKEVVLCIFDHEYRSFEGFTCLIGIYVPEGYVYIIDALKFRDVIAQLRLFTCQVKKIFHSQKDVERVLNDFGSMGCYQNFNVPESNVYVDWRIRPLNEILCSIICSELIETVEKVNNRFITEVHEKSTKNELEEFLNTYNLGDTLSDLTSDLLKLRTYLARNNDESVQFVMTDDQLYSIIINKPSNVQEFEVLFERMSSVLRLHVGDFLLILNKKSPGFSLENLKTKSVISVDDSLKEEITNRHRSFEKSNENELNREESDFSFEISD